MIGDDDDDDNDDLLIRKVIFCGLHGGPENNIRKKEKSIKISSP